jgi:ElaB/YqjD/DUF883 family membrane-anchored ribosome-binding protein
MQNHTTAKTRDALLHDVDKLKRDAVQVVNDVRKHATAHVDETKERVTDTIDAFRENLTAHPLALLGAGFVLGVLVGFRLRR